MGCLGHGVQRGIQAAARRFAAEPHGAGGGANVAAALSKSGFWRDTALLWALASFSLLLHLLVASRCDFFIDELYILATIKRSLMGCADEFPVQLWLMRLSTAVLGDTPFAVRFFPAVSGSIGIVIAGLLARELGGGRFAVSIAGLGVFAAPFLLYAAGYANAWSYEALPWSLSAILVARILRTGNWRLWWMVGVVWGVGLLTKPTVLLFMLGVGFGLLVTRAREELFRKGYWSALAVALFLFSPALAWQAVHGWPFLDMATAMRSDEWAESGNWVAYFSRSKMLLAQPAWLGPLNCALAVVGILYFLLSRRERACHAVLWACMAAGVAFFLTSGFTYYTMPTYPILMAFGAVAAAQLTARMRLRWLRAVLVLGLLAQGLLTAPLCVPLLPRDVLSSYARVVGRGILAPLSSTAETFQDNDYYEKLPKTFSLVYETLSAGEKENCCIFVGFAPWAAVAEHYRAKYHLPKVYCPHMNFLFWGPPDEGTSPVIALCFSRKQLDRWFSDVECLGTFFDANAPPVFLCRSPRFTYERIWLEMCREDSSYRWRVDREG